jgi:hypothetical protein
MLKKSGISTDKKERKLTQLLDTRGEFMIFSSYYLWFLIDVCRFVVEDVEILYVYSKSTAYNPFVTEMMQKRLENAEQSEFFKLVMNSTYGNFLKNLEKYTKAKIVNSDRADIMVVANNFVSVRKLNDNIYDEIEENKIDEHGEIQTTITKKLKYEALYQVNSLPKSFGCDTDIANGVLTLDNSKYIYLSFIYRFLYQCLDMEKIHYAEGDTDSMFLSVAGDPNDDYHQAFKHVILDENFYNENVYKWLPSGFYTTNKTNPTFANKIKQKKFDKKLGGFAIEKECECLVALALKVYYFYNLGDDEKCIE